MDRLKLGGVQLEYEVHGSGEPVLLIHGAHIADAMRPLVDEPALDGFQLIRYHRRGFAGSDHPPGPTSIGEQADDAAGVLDGLGVDPTHVVGHSLGGVIALELAARRPTQVLSLSLLEPALLTGPAGAIFGEHVEPLVELYGNGDPAAAVDGFLALVGGPGWQETIEASVPGGVAQARADAATFFEVELPAVSAWTFGPDRSAAIACPVLSVLGTHTAPLFVEGRRHLHSWFDECHDTDIAGATHLLQMEQPRQIATAIAEHCTAIVAGTR
ncbi:MAG: alpha/beta fold hydrolase [Acidimicrobiales bacterium]